MKNQEQFIILSENRGDYTTPKTKLTQKMKTLTPQTK